MPKPLPHVREAGAGAGLLCRHANASSSTQWRGLMDGLAPALPQVHTQSFDGWGRMGPVTHPDLMNHAIARFLDTCR